MQYRKLGKSGLFVSVIGFGGIPIQRVPASEAHKIINRALDLGINFFDTARAYTDSEMKLGSALKMRRKEAVIATKSLARTKDAMAADIRKSLETMGLDYIDLYQMHNIRSKSDLEAVTNPDGAIAALVEAKENGLIRHIGITSHIKEILSDTLPLEVTETIQFPFNAVETVGVSALLAKTAENNTGVIVMKPLAGGALNKPILALRYVLEHPVTTVIPGMDSLEQVEENARCGNDIQALTVSEKQSLEAEANNLNNLICRRCEYCKPCSRNIDIPTVFLLDGYYTRYKLPDWSRDRYKSLPTKAEACTDCGNCETKCPYNLPIRKMLTAAATRLA